MTEIDIKQLQTEGRCVTYTINCYSHIITVLNNIFFILLLFRFSDGGIKHFYLLLYLPFGFIVALLRLILGLVVIILGNILPDVSFTRNLLSNLCRAIFGIVIHIDNVTIKDNVKLIISNHVSPLDHFVVHIATGCILVWFIV